MALRWACVDLEGIGKGPIDMRGVGMAVVNEEGAVVPEGRADVPRSLPQEAIRLRGRHTVHPEWVTDTEVSYKEEWVRELGKEVFDFHGNEGCAGR